jgi:hypothetical protein
MLFMAVTAEVLNSGISSKEPQLLNILFMLVTAEVSNKGTDCREVQPLNMFCILTVPVVLVLIGSTCLMEKQF